ncbi:MAG: patatin-like phospholipase family protein [Candidatus Magasanikbacteria bacterium]|nr:patatin-like phospholipase family protein [Candidatus Magasanikbacteria bacterium]
MSNTHKKIGLVLGGGGAKSFAHLGIIDVFREHNIPIDVIVSCSAGSLFGAFAANNISSKRVKEVFVPRLSRSKWFLPGLSRKGFLSQKNIKDISKKLCGDICIEDCAIPFHTVVTNINTGDLHVCNSGNLAKSIGASMAFPGMYAPVKIDGELYVDGGVLNGIPADVCRNIVGKDGVVISINLDGVMRGEIKNYSMIGVVYRSLYISLFKQRQKILKENSDIVIPVFHKTNFNFKSWRDILTFYSIKKMDEFYELGREKAHEHIESIKESIII